MSQKPEQLGNQSHGITRRGAKARKWLKKVTARIWRREAKEEQDPDTEITPRHRFSGYWD